MRTTNFPPTESSYWLLTLERTINQSNINHEIEVNEELIRKINLFLSERNINTLVCQKSDKVIILIEHSTFKSLNIDSKTFINLLLKYCLQRFKNYKFYIGGKYSNRRFEPNKYFV